MISRCPLVSVFVPTYNHAELIEKSIMSIINQTYKNLEIIISDDASTDNAVDIIMHLRKAYPDIIKVNLNKVRLGLTKNSNKALGLCTGDFIAFHSGDDWMYPDKLEVQLAEFAGNDDLILCYHDVEVYDRVSNKVLYLFSERHYMPIISKDIYIKNGLFFPGLSAMLKRNGFEDHQYDNRLNYISDIKFFADIVLKIDNLRRGMAYVPKILSRYVRHCGNITNKSNDYELAENRRLYGILRIEFPDYANDLAISQNARLLSVGSKQLLKKNVIQAIRIFCMVRSNIFSSYYYFLKSAVRNVKCLLS